jgi:large subunit ribosomal protein L13
VVVSLGAQFGVRGGSAWVGAADARSDGRGTPSWSPASGRVATVAGALLYHPAAAARVRGGFLMLMKTYVATQSDRQRDWYVVDASGETLGRLATQIADVLRGKRKPTYTPHVDTGDFVIVVNADKIAVTGNKRSNKLYHRHSGYPGGLRTRTLDQMLSLRPEEVIRLAVKGMMPRNRLARKQLTKLKVYAGPDHPHAAQQPTAMELRS